MTGAQFKEIANKQGDDLQREINQYTPGTDAYDMAEIASQIDTSNPNKRSSFGNNVQNFAGGGLVQSISDTMIMNQGGTVPGSGNKDTVPAMLTPGEFVMNKASSAKIGVQNLMKMNANMGKGILGGAKKLAMKHPLAQMLSGAKDKLGQLMGDKEGDEDKVIGIAVADIPKGSPLMKSAKPPAGDAIKPPTKPAGMGGMMQVDKSLMKGVGGAQGMPSGSGKQLPPIDAAKKISANKIAVLGITV